MHTRPTAVQLLALSAALALGGVAQAQLIRPDSATATSEFNSNYRVLNTINGSGLPANFALSDAHANYAVGNHWTTATGRTIGESATYTFNTAQTIGGFHMWTHRSNSIASNAFYEPVLFDLVLFDGPGGTGATIATLTNIPAAPNVATAQTFPFDMYTGVRSIRFIVRATENNNSSPFTGLAEVAFSPCVVATVTSITSSTPCPERTWTASVAATGSGALTYQWRKDGQAIDTQSNPSAATSTLTLATISESDEGDYDCVVTNVCGEATSQAATLVVPGCDCIDYNNDGLFPDDADLVDFLSVLAGGGCSTGDCGDVDINNDGLFPDDADLVALLGLLAGSTC